MLLFQEEQSRDEEARVWEVNKSRRRASSSRRAGVRSRGA